MGADGIILWGSSSDAHVSGYDTTINKFLEGTVGPLLKGCEADRAQCAAAFCSAHGQCSNYDAGAPETGCKAPLSAGSVSCVCDDGWHGSKCDQPS